MTDRLTWQKPVCGEGMLLMDKKGGVYNPWYLVYCDIKLATAENMNKDIWRPEVGVYTDLISACNARLKFMSIHKDRYYRIIQANMKKKNYITPITEIVGVETETVMITATVGITTTNQEAASGTQGSGPIPGDAYADEDDIGAKRNPFEYDPNWGE